MKISTPAKEYLIEIEVRKFTPKTIRSYRNNLNLFLRFCEEQAHVTDVEDLSLAVVRQFSLYMSIRGRKGSYITGLLKVAKAFIQYCYEEDYGGFNTKKNFRWCKQDKSVVMAFKPSDVRQIKNQLFVKYKKLIFHFNILFILGTIKSATALPISAVVS